MSGQQLPINLSGVIVAALLILAAVLDPNPLESHRPPRASVGPEPTDPFESVPARIWEDPFEAIERLRPQETERNDKAEAEPTATAQPRTLQVHWFGVAGRHPIRFMQPGPSAFHYAPQAGKWSLYGQTMLPTPTSSTARNAQRDPSPPQQYLSYLATIDQTTRLMVMPIMVRASPYPVDREWRLRIRLATHAALAHAGFHPLQPERIGVWTWKPSLAIENAREREIEIEIPFEAFRWKSRRESRIILVLWLNDEAIHGVLGEFSGRWSDGDSPNAGKKPYSGPLTTVDKLVEEIGYPQNKQDNTSPRPFYCTKPDPSRKSTNPAFTSCSIRVIGPASSDSLKRIYVELLGWRGSQCDGAYSHIDNRADPTAEDLISSPWADKPINFKLVSPFATAPITLLSPAFHGDRLDRLAAESIRIRDPKVYSDRDAPCANVVVHRTIHSDDKAIHLLVEELKTRGVDPTQRQGGYASLIHAFLAAHNPGPGRESPTPLESRDHIALISEQDTRFGRALPRMFQSRIADLWCQNNRASDPCPENVPPPPWVHTFFYMRGLDGTCSAVTTPPSNNASLIKDGKLDLMAIAAGQDAGFKEPAIGTNQYDYLRRLTQQIADLDVALKSTDRGAIRAFGILGSNYYDKLLILQALKERFPSHLYFTNDLDAGLLDAKAFSHTRNLIITAPFGLSPRQNLDRPRDAYTQGEFPPFRHSLQTSVYLATLAILQGDEAKLAEQVRSSGHLLFEVGRHRFFQVEPPEIPAIQADKHWYSSLPVRPRGQASVATSGKGPADKTIDFDDIATARTQHWNSGILSFLRTHLITLALIALMGLFAIRSLSSNGSSLIRRFDSPNPHFEFATSHPSLWRWHLNHPSMLIVSIYIALTIIAVLEFPSCQEPFAFVSGISTWPSEIMRLIAGLAASLLLVHGWRQLKDGDERITQRFGLQESGPHEQAPDDYPAWSEGRGSDRTTPIAEKACKFFGYQTTWPSLWARLSMLIGFRIGRREDDVRVRSENDRGARPSIQTEWQRYRRHATLLARAARVVPATLAFWLLSFFMVYGLSTPLPPYRGDHSYWLGMANGWLFAGLPFMLLLLAAVDEALLCSRFLRKFETTDGFSWPIGAYQSEAQCQFDQAGNLASARDYWLSTELIAERTAPAAQFVHLPIVVILFLMLSLSSRFDNWGTPASVLLLIGVSIGIALVAGILLRGTARRIRNQLLRDLKDEIAGIDYRAARTPSDRLLAVVRRIESIHDGAFTEWYNEPVFRALAWALAIAILIVTEYSAVLS
ncbi:hypothetical protein [Imhoffiella purpurea]|uniref:Uncharacterized protein n=1 Tax=Imhoffiella purpurea TaxID=1249627 RepID=W9V816_9GAMM|nr:hypothetical protein [Imhoffiella purpurea]EXJ15569.1 hypothetical protein D779_1311 [Imhoffiella purpurea]